MARHRNIFYWVTVLLFGRKIEPLRFDAVQSIFQKLLAAIFLIAFISFGVQAPALIGSHGVEPVSLYFRQVEAQLGSSAWQSAPSLYWLRTDDLFVQGVWMCGAACSLLAILGVFWRGALLVAFRVLLVSLQCFAGVSLIPVGHPVARDRFSSLVPRPLAGCSMAVPVAPVSVDVPVRRRETSQRRSYMAQSHGTDGSFPDTANSDSGGLVCAPTAGMVPEGRLVCLVLVVELLVPFLVLGTRRMRFAAAPWLIGLQLMIMLTGNYAFFNWLSLSLCLFLFDDAQLERIIRRVWIQRRTKATVNFVSPAFRQGAVFAAGLVIFLLSSMFTLQALGFQIPAVARTLISTAAPFGITSSYGLFATMTTIRPEIVIEGSNDGSDWREYEFRYKPGRLDRRPPWVAPHQPRIDWQMWFAALGRYQENVWFLNLLARLLQNNPAVLSQFERNPFPGCRTAVYPSEPLRISFYRLGNAATNAQLVEQDTSWALRTAGHVRGSFRSAASKI